MYNKISKSYVRTSRRVMIKGGWKGVFVDSVTPIPSLEFIIFKKLII